MRFFSVPQSDSFASSFQRSHPHFTYSGHRGGIKRRDVDCWNTLVLFCWANDGGAGGCREGRVINKRLSIYTVDDDDCRYCFRPLILERGKVLARTTRVLCIAGKISSSFLRHCTDRPTDRCAIVEWDSPALKATAK